MKYHIKAGDAFVAETSDEQIAKLVFEHVANRDEWLRQDVELFRDGVAIDKHDPA